MPPNHQELTLHIARLSLVGSVIIMNTQKIEIALGRCLEIIAEKPYVRGRLSSYLSRIRHDPEWLPDEKQELHERLLFAIDNYEVSRRP
jgi:hypothetical protein